MCLEQLSAVLVTKFELVMDFCFDSYVLFFSLILISHDLRAGQSRDPAHSGREILGPRGIIWYLLIGIVICR